MKWPLLLGLIRHDVSAFNVLKGEKSKDPDYRRFCQLFDKDPESTETVAMAQIIYEKFSLSIGDAQTPLVDEEATKAMITGRALSGIIEIPDVVFVSPYLRAIQTKEGLQRGWPELANVPVYEEERIREQEHGLALLFSDWRIFFAFYPEQRRLQKIQGRYYYQWPQGESMPMVRDRNRSWISTLVRDWRGKRVLAVTHHKNILALRANLERLSAEKFLQLDEEDKPINCGVTIYNGMPEEGENGRLRLHAYNQKLY